MSAEKTDPETHISPAQTHDQEKNPITTLNYGDQIPLELLETLAPNGEGDFILSKINGMGEDEAIAIITESLTFHSDDWNFPSDMRERMERLLLGPKAYGEFYERDLRIDATMMKWSSPYPGVRAVASPVDDPKVPIETIRAYFLGISWAIIGTFMATFFTSRFPGISKFHYPIYLLLGSVCYNASFQNKMYPFSLIPKSSLTPYPKTHHDTKYHTTY